MYKPDEYQQKIICSDAKDMVIKAGAGSGKTSTMLERIKYLTSEKDVDPKSIIVLTFTNVAANHMRLRYSEGCDESCDSPYFGTFHAFCYKILSENLDAAEALGYSDTPYISNGIEMRIIKNDILNSIGSKLSFKQLSNPERLKGKSRLEYDHYIKLFDRYIKRNVMIDFDTLSREVCRLFIEDSDVVADIKNKCAYLFVDEFQDTDDVQFAFVQSMQNSNRCLFGDPMQNIYGFRGCTNEPMKNLLEDDSWESFEMPIDYRSTYEICSYVNDSSSTFYSRRFGVDLISCRSGANVREFKYESIYDMYKMLIRYVKIKGEEGSVACLFRTNKEVSECAEMMKANDIAFSSSFSDDYAYNIIMSCKYKKHRSAWLQAKLSKQDYEKYSMIKRSTGSDPIETKEYRFGSIESVVSDIDDMSRIVAAGDIPNLRSHLNLKFSISVQDESCESVDSVLYAAAYESTRKRTDENVFIGTVHSSKGLEFDSVAVLGPKGPTFKLDCEDNQNLFYTACTRAKDNLIVFYGECL